MSQLLSTLQTRGLVSPAELRALEGWAPYSGASLAERLYRSGLLSDADLVALFVSLGAADATDELLAGRPTAAALGAISRALAEKHRVLPLRLAPSRLVVAMLDPSDSVALEKIAFYCGLAVESRAVRPRVLFQALHDAFGMPMVLPDSAFLAERHAAAGGPTPSQADDESDALPPPTAPPPTAPPPARRAVRPPAASDGFDVDADTQELLPDTLVLTDLSPASTPAAPASLPPQTPLEARDSLPPQVLRLLAPPMRSAVLFLMRGNVAVGWDGAGEGISRARIRDVLLPLTAPSVLERAFSWKRVAVGHPGDPTTTERMLFRALGGPSPTSCAVVPILVGDDVTALLYIDTRAGLVDDLAIDVARRAGRALADGLAPFVAADALFPNLTLAPFPRIKSPS